MRNHKVRPAAIWKRGIPCALLAVAVAYIATAAAHAGNLRELYQIRVTNSTDGLVEVSTDQGRSYCTLGHVVQPATTSIQGYAASVYAARGTVAAVAVHGIHIKTGETPVSRGKAVSYVMSIVPREFAKASNGFGGHVPGPSGIYTDIPAAAAIFRNLSPFVGNPVLLERSSKPAPLPDNYTPRQGDALVIKAEIPVRWLQEIIIENRNGGNVEAVYPDSKETIAAVIQPVKGIGRFDATDCTGVGRINTNHTGTITISTAPIRADVYHSSQVERRGGFMVQPSRHAQPVLGMPQVLVVGPKPPDGSALEGAPPLFSGFIGLAYDPGSDADSYTVEIKTPQSGWRAMPALIGKQDAALESLSGGVTDIRIRFPRLTTEWIAAQLRRCRRQYLDLCRERFKEQGKEPASGILEFGLRDAPPDKTRFVTLLVDGKLVGMSSVPSYTFSVDSSCLANGKHTAELRALDAYGVSVKAIKTSFLILHEETED